MADEELGKLACVSDGSVSQVHDNVLYLQPDVGGCSACEDSSYQNAFRCWQVETTGQPGVTLIGEMPTNPRST